MPSCGPCVCARARTPKPADRLEKLFLCPIFLVLCVCVLQVNGCCRLTVTHAHAREQVHVLYVVCGANGISIIGIGIGIGRVGLRIRRNQRPFSLLIFVKTLTHFIRDVCVYYPLRIAPLGARL